MAASIVDLTNQNVVQIQTLNGATVAKITASSDFPPEKDPVDTRKKKQKRSLLSKNSFNASNLTNLVDHDASTRKLDDSGAYLDIMVVWTKLAECAASGLGESCTLTANTEATMRTKLALAVSETNEAYSSTGVNTELVMVHAYRHPDYVESSFEVSLDDLQTEQISGISSNRQIYGADLVALIVGTSEYCGLAFVGPDNSFMFSVTNQACATGYYTFGHEIGHNLGLYHDRGTEDACSTGGYNYGYRDPNANFRTIMSYDCEAGECDNNAGGSCTRIAKFSNPNFLYNGLALGSSTEDNVRAMNDVRVEVAGYLPHAEARTPCAADELDVVVYVNTDGYPEENTWDISTSSGSVATKAFSDQNKGYADALCLANTECYTFTFNDSYGDGLQDGAHFTLLVDDTVVFEDNNGKSYSSLSEEFGPACGGVVTPAPAPSSSCVDSPFRFRLRKNGRNISRGCTWVANKDTNNRCNLTGVASMCPDTCGVCSSCSDGQNRFRFRWNGRMINRDCTWVGNKQTIQRCAVEGMSDTCRVTCDNC